MAVELATAYISIVADTKQLKNSIDSSTSGLSGQMDKKGRSLGGGLMKGIGVGVLGGVAAVTAAGVGTLGVALTKGFSRLNSLDQATAKLSGLGHSAEAVDGIMKNALASVKGTAFGMDEAAGVAAGLVAANVKPGQDLERSLKLVADASTIAGTSMGDMGAIFNKVAGSGKIQGDVIAQLGDKGIPILQLLSKEMGVSAEEVSKMASKGEIDFARFQNAMEAGMGGAALKSGETFKGALANVNASLGRIGAGLLGGVFGQLAPTLSAITVAMGPLEKVASDLGVKLGDLLMPMFEGLRNILDGGFDFSPFIELAGYLSPIGLAFKTLQPVLPQIGEALAQVGASLAGALGDVIPKLLPLLGSLVTMLSDTLASVFPMILPLLPLLADALGEVARVLAGGLAEVLPVILPILGELITMIASTVAAIVPALLPALTMVAEIFGQVLTAVMPLVSALLSGLMPILQQLLGAIVPIITPLLDLLQPLLDLVMVILPPLITLLTFIVQGSLMALQGALAFLMPIIEGVVQAISTGLAPWIEALTSHFQHLSDFLTGVFSGNWEQVWGAVQGIFDDAWGNMVNIAKGAMNSITDLVNGVIDGLNGFGDFLGGVTGGAVNFEIGHLPRLADGATIQPRRGGTLAVLAEAGRAESVVDTGLLNRALEQGIPGSGAAAGGGATLNVYPAPGMDETTIGVIAARELSSALRGT